MNFRTLIPAATCVLLFTACGGSSHPSPQPPALAAGLAYVNPTLGKAEWGLLKDITSTSTHLVLNLVGPTDATKYRGVGFSIDTPAASGARFAPFKGTDGKSIGYFKDGGIFLDKDPSGADMAPMLAAGGMKGQKLMVGIFQRTDDGIFGTAGATAKDCNNVVLQIALDFDPSAKALPGTVPITIQKAQAIPESITTLSTRRMKDITLKAGTLTLQ